MTKDIVFDAAESRFNYRVGAIIIDSGKILMVKNVDNFISFYYTVGGRVRLDESAEEAVLRESFEETIKSALKLIDWHISTRISLYLKVTTNFTTKYPCFS